jgi:large subunit ribosomal protein L9
MKIILTSEVSGLGAPGDIVEVRDGYGRNYLLPQGFAIPWSKGAEKQVTSIKRARSAREIRDLGHANEVRAQLEALKVSLTARAGTGGRLFGSVTPSEVQEAVKAAGGPELDKRRIELPGHIKAVGQYQVSVRLHPEVTARFALSVVAAKSK